MQPAKNSQARIVIALIFVKIFILTGIAYAQKVAGIYLSAKDFSEHKIAFASTHENKYIIRLNIFFNNSIIKIISKNKVYKLQKDSVFGYTDNTGISYRLYKRNIYTILNSDTNLIVYKTLNTPASKYVKADYTYYFSRNVNTEIKDLTLKNIEFAYQENKQFILFLELYFKNDEELIEFDQLHNTHKLNRLLQLSYQRKIK